MILAWLLAGPAGPLPDSWASELPALAAQADPAEKDTALAQFTCRAGQHSRRQRHERVNCGISSACRTDPRPGQSPGISSRSCPWSQFWSHSPAFSAVRGRPSGGTVPGGGR